MIYASGCFVILQLVDILSDPLALPAAATRNLLLVMLVCAPLLTAATAWYLLRGKSARGNADPDTLDDNASRFALGKAQIDLATRQIYFEGETADVQPKVFDLIEYLIRTRDRVVSKDELFDAIWPSVVVSEASLTQLIKRARNLFREHGFETDIIRTVSRKGYQLDYPVTSVGQTLPETARPWLAAVVPTLLVSGIALVFVLLIMLPAAPVSSPTSVTIPDNSLAVLPFTDLSPASDFGYFADGLTESVTDTLTRVRGLRVIASTSAFTARDNNLLPGAIEQQLRVGHIVEGSVQRNGDNLRISARLVRLADGSQLWSQIYNRQLDDIFSLHDDISGTIVEQMSGILTASLDIPTQAIAPIANSLDSEAYRLLLQGRELRRDGSTQALEQAELLFRQALDLKPDYAEAMVALADSIRLRAVVGELPRESSFSEALSLANQALVLQPDSADALLQIGEIQHRHFWNFEDAETSYRQAIAINPGSAAAHSAYSRFLSKAGRQNDAVNEARIALDLDPLSSSAGSSLTIRLIRGAALDEARQELDAFKAKHPDHYDIPWLEANWHIANSTYTQALQNIALEELDYLRLSLSAIALHYLGRTAQAQQALDELIATDADGAAFQIAEVYAHWQDIDAAFDWLDRAFRQGDPGLAELYSSVNLANLYADPRFVELASQIGLPSPPAGFQTP